MKFETQFKKKYAEQLTGMSAADHVAFSELHIQELQRWIDDVEPDSDVEEIEPPETPEGKRGNRTRCASYLAGSGG